MRIIHCADLHLDSPLSANLPKEKARERRNELLITFQNMLKFAVRSRVRAVLIAGDLFDTNHISAHCRDIVLGALRDYSMIDFYYLKGNHDKNDLFAGIHELPENLHMFGGDWTEYRLTDGGRYPVVITGAELSADNAGRIYSGLLLPQQAFNIVMLHGQEAEKEEPGSGDVIGIRSLRGKNIDYLALGHIHQFKQAQLDARGIYCYPGCLEGRGFDECGEHGFVLLDINTDTQDYTAELVPGGGRLIAREEADVSECADASEVAALVRAQLARKGYPESSMLKLVLTGEIDADLQIDTDYLEKLLAPDFYFVKTEDQTTVRIDYDAYMTDLSLKGEFVRTVRAADLPEDVAARVIRTGFATLAGGDL